MERSIEEMARDGSERVADYVDDVLRAVGQFTDTLLDDVATLTRGVIREGRKVVAAARGAFL